ncbi:MAG: alpha/beta hydrolase [Anaerolineales bacterium]|nr:alpha/beta hydrolase [Anaerolineales bacterium]
MMVAINHTAQHHLINGRNLFVETYGHADDPALFFLHQGLGSTYSWKEQTQFFAQAGYYVIVYDRWGYGKSDPRHSVITSGFADDIADLTGLVGVLNIQRAALIGHSDGGTLTLYFAALNPEITACIVIISAHIYIELKMKPGIMQVRKMFYENIWFRNALERLHGEKTSRVFSNWYDGWMNPVNLDWDMRPLIRRISCPTLVIQGDEDEHATPQHARDIAEAIPGADLWMPTGGKHLFPQVQPEIFNTKTLSFLKKNYVP